MRNLCDCLPASRPTDDREHASTHMPLLTGLGPSADDRSTICHCLPASAPPADDRACINSYVIATGIFTQLELGQIHIALQVGDFEVCELKRKCWRLRHATMPIKMHAHCIYRVLLWQPEVHSAAAAGSGQFHEDVKKDTIITEWKYTQHHRGFMCRPPFWFPCEINYV